MWYPAIPLSHFLFLIPHPRFGFHSSFLIPHSRFGFHSSFLIPHSDFMTPSEFIQKWRDHELSERSAAQQHFCDLCELVEHPKPAEADATGVSLPESS
jgi:hypothetical protein